jgi:beta-glucosidase
MNTLGLMSYRFSISWVRIYPNGHGTLNPKGVAFYNRLINRLIEESIEPVVTLWHGDLPLVYENQGGWFKPITIDHYLNYAKTLFDLYGDRINIWFTHNEPWCTAFLNDRPFSEQLQIAHHMMIAHAKAVQLYRQHPHGHGKIGIVLNLGKQYAKTFDPMDGFAARNIEGFVNRFFLDPVLKGKYPKDMIDLYEKAGHTFKRTNKEMTLIKQNRMDFLGINMYTRGIQAYDPFNKLFYSKDASHPEATYTEMGWEVCPRSLYDLLMDIQEKYDNIEVMITENGAAFSDDKVTHDRVYDEDRVQYFKGHLQAVCDAIKHGCNITRYYAWSLLDNFEWGLGYSKRFGIIRVDYETQKRTIKDSGKYYAKVIQTRKV